MKTDQPRIEREKRTIRAMAVIYCHAKHDTRGSLCDECGEFLEYAFARLDRCPLSPDKPTCGHCTVHCYKPAMRERAKTIMGFAGPRMLLKHPILTFLHWLDGRRGRPGKTSR